MDRLFGWVVTRDRIHFLERPLPLGRLSRLVAAYRAALENRALLGDTVHRRRAGYTTNFCDPSSPSWPRSGRSSSFRTASCSPWPSPASGIDEQGAIWSRTTPRPGAERHRLSPGFDAAASSESAASPRRTRRRKPSLRSPPLRRTCRICQEPKRKRPKSHVSTDTPSLLTGKELPRPPSSAGYLSSEIVHYAGHAASTREIRSTTARLFFARDPTDRRLRGLFLHELARQRFPRTRVVVLAACRTAAGAGVTCRGRPEPGPALSRRGRAECRCQPLGHR